MTEGTETFFLLDATCRNQYILRYRDGKPQSHFTSIDKDGGVSERFTPGALIFAFNDRRGFPPARQGLILATQGFQLAIGDDGTLAHVRKFDARLNILSYAPEQRGNRVFHADLWYDITAQTINNMERAGISRDFRLQYEHWERLDKKDQPHARLESAALAFALAARMPFPAHHYPDMRAEGARLYHATQDASMLRVRRAVACYVDAGRAPQAA